MIWFLVCCGGVVWLLLVHIPISLCRNKYINFCATKAYIMNFMLPLLQ